MIRPPNLGPLRMRLRSVECTREQGGVTVSNKRSVVDLARLIESGGLSLQAHPSGRANYPGVMQLVTHLADMGKVGADLMLIPKTLGHTERIAQLASQLERSVGKVTCEVAGENIEVEEIPGREHHYAFFPGEDRVAALLEFLSMERPFHRILKQICFRIGVDTKKLDRGIGPAGCGSVGLLALDTLEPLRSLLINPPSLESIGEALESNPMRGLVLPNQGTTTGFSAEVRISLFGSYGSPNVYYDREDHEVFFFVPEQLQVHPGPQIEFRPTEGTKFLEYRQTRIRSLKAMADGLTQAWEELIV